MLTSFFKNSKPINFLLVGVFMAVFFFVANFIDTKEAITWSYTFQKIGFLLVFLMLMLLINFIVKRNQVTQKNTFTIALFAVFTVMFQPILENGDLLLSALLVMLALRRVVSLRSGKNTKKKIFDAALWIGVASLSVKISIVFLLLPFCGVLFHTPKNLKNWFLPIVAIACVFILKTSWNLFFHNQFYIPWQGFSLNSFGFETYHNLNVLLPLSVLLAFSLWVIYHYFKKLNAVGRKKKPTYYLIFCMWILAIFAVVLSPQKDGSELLWFILPVSIIGANYFQTKKEKWFKESLLLALFLISILLLFIDF